MCQLVSPSRHLVFFCAQSCSSYSSLSYFQCETITTVLSVTFSDLYCGAAMGVSTSLGNLSPLNCDGHQPRFESLSGGDVDPRTRSAI